MYKIKKISITTQVIKNYKIYGKSFACILEHRLAAIILLSLMSAEALARLSLRLISIAKSLILIKFRVDETFVYRRK
jgi:hypothetical protein